MTDQEINVAIAEACGWKWIGSPEQVLATMGYTMPDKWVVAPDGTLHFRHDIPNYCTDLNAMHEAEMAIYDDFGTYLGHLADLCDAEPRATEVATARQRAEAFLRTIGKWRDQ